MGFELHNPEAVAAQIKKLVLSFQSVSQDVQVRVRQSPTLVEVLFRHNDQRMAGFTLIAQPNCCGILVSTATFVEKVFQKNGLAQAMMPLKDAIAKEFGYSCLIATVNVTGNPAEAHILIKCGWTKDFTFVNSRTKNTVGMFHKNL